jgi:hypothetical protein
MMKSTSLLDLMGESWKCFADPCHRPAKQPGFIGQWKNARHNTILLDVRPADNRYIPLLF